MLSFYDEVSDHVKFVRIHHHFPSFVLESNRAVRKSSHWPIIPFRGIQKWRRGKEKERRRAKRKKHVSHRFETTRWTERIKTKTYSKTEYILPRDRQSTIMCSWELKRDLLSLSLSLSLSCDKEKKTNAVRYHQYKHALKASEVSIVLRPSSHVWGRDN